MRISYTECPVCQNKELTPFLICKDYTVSGENFEISYCNHCQTGLTQNIPDSASIGTYYKSANYISHTDTKKGLVNQLYHLARNFMLRSKRQLVLQQTGLQQGKLLDIGSGTGYFLDNMRQNKWEVMGVEADEDAKRFAEQNFKVSIFSPQKLNELPEKQFDAITLWHVLEHLHDLDSTWAHFLRLLKDKGVLFIAVPNHQSADARHYQAHWAAYDVPRHLWHFSPKSIKFLAEKHGFYIVKKRLMPFDPFYISLLSEKYAGNAWGTFLGAWQGGIALLNGLVNVDCSSSLIYVLKKK